MSFAQRIINRFVRPTYRVVHWEDSVGIAPVVVHQNTPAGWGSVAASADSSALDQQNQALRAGEAPGLYIDSSTEAASQLHRQLWRGLFAFKDGPKPNTTKNSHDTTGRHRPVCRAVHRPA